MYSDAETGFVYLRARYYDPATGQFISRDPLVAMTGTAYGYVDGNPLNFTDTLGLSSCGQFSLGGLVDCGAKVGRNAAVTAKIAGSAAAAAVTPALEAGVNAAADAVSSVGNAINSVGHAIPGALVEGTTWTGACLAEYCVGHPFEGLAAVAALTTVSGVAIYGGVLACTTVLGCIVGAPVIAAGIAGIGASAFLAYQEIGHWRSFLPTVEAAEAETWCP